MAQIDPNIAMGFRPIQIESPINQMAAISQLENARQQQQMNMLQMQEYARKAREDQDLASQRNALAQIHSNLPPGVKIGSEQYLNLVASKAPRFLPDIMDQQTKREGLVALREEREARTEEREFKLGQKKEEISQAKIKQAIADIADFDDLESINADIDRKLASNELSQAQAAQIRSKLPADNSGVPAWQRQTLLSLLELKDRVTEQAKLKESIAPKWELRKVGERELLVDTNPKSATVGQLKPGVEPLVDTTPKPSQIKVGETVFYRDINPNSPTYGTNIGDVFVDEEPKWELKTVGNKQMLVDTNPRSSTVGQMKPGAEALVDKTPRYTARDIGGKIVYVDENPDSPTFGQQKTDAALTKTAAPVAEKPEPRTDAQKNYDAAKAGGYPGTFDDFLDQQRESADEREWRKAVKKGEFKGTFLEWKKALRPVSNTYNPPPVQTITVQGPNGPELRDARTGRRITDDRGQALVPYDASNKPLSPVQQQKLAKDRAADDAKVTAAKDMADDIEKNVDALLGNKDKKIKPHPGLPGITGYNALIPSLPGGQPRAAQQLLDNVKGKVTMIGKNLASQEGKLGNMAVQEWKIVADALERIDAASPNFADQLQNVVRQARRLETNLKTRRNQMYAAPSGGSDIQNQADAILGK